MPKKAREKGKIKFSRYFQELKIGDRVAVVREISLGNVQKTLQGRSGIIMGKRGRSYIVKIKHGKNKAEKQHILKAVHLKKLK